MTTRITILEWCISYFGLLHFDVTVQCFFNWTSFILEKCFALSPSGVMAPSVVECVPNSRYAFPLCFLPLDNFLSCDQNRKMAACTAVRCSMRLTFRVSRLIPDCTTCPWRQLKTSDSPGANFQKTSPFMSFQTINRHLQTSIGERR